MNDLKPNGGKRCNNLHLLCYILLSIIFSICITYKQAIANDELFGLDPSDLDVVLTPTRLKQNRRDVPASITVISENDIKKLGIQTIPEALRLVPGMAVGKRSGNAYRIDYHGTNGLTPRRMQILIDGVSYFRAGLAQIFWKELPVDIEDVHRIEITRSPSTASYGANSFLAVVNIITKHPTDVLGIRATLSAGSLNTKKAFIGYGGELSPLTHYRLSISHRQDSGYDQDNNENNINGEGFDNVEDDTYVSSFDFRSSTHLNSQSELDIYANLVNSTAKNENGDINQQTNPHTDLIDRNISIQYTNQISPHNQLQIKTYINSMQRKKYWDTCYPAIAFSNEMRNLYRAAPQKALDIFEALPALPTLTNDEAELNVLIDALINKMNSLGTQATEPPICGELNENYKERRVGYEVQDTHVFSSQLRMVAGLGFNRNLADSETFLNGNITIDSQYIFTNVEYQPSKKTTFNIGAMWENEEKRTDGIEHSPRAAFNYHLHPNHTLRFIYSEAIRTPDMLESDRDWNYTMRNMNPRLYNGDTKGLFFVNTSSNANQRLKSEKIRAKEISYYANFPKLDISLDIKLFRDNLRDLISEKLEFFRFSPSNNSTSRLKGVEIQLEFQPKAKLSAYAAYAYMDNKSTNPLEKTLFTKHSGSAFISYQFNNKLRSTLAYYGSNSIGGFSYDRFDLNLSKSFKTDNQSTWEAAFKVQHYGSTRSGYIIDELSVLQHRFNSDTHYFISLSWKS
ncbi:MAG: TonB-dependent receptor [Gammaproteobacteria bacterium]|nr:TonB-dependent receptor [Gammaproteobacteria bacterium]